jgi:hypothetical protein
MNNTAGQHDGGNLEETTMESNAISDKPTTNPKQEVLDHLGNALAIIDCLFTLNATGDFSSLFESTLDTMLDSALRSINSAHKLISSEEASA